MYAVFTFVPTYFVNINKPNYYLTTSWTRIPMPLISCHTVKNTTTHDYSSTTKNKAFKTTLRLEKICTFFIFYPFVDVQAFPDETIERPGQNRSNKSNALEGHYITTFILKCEYPMQNSEKYEFSSTHDILFYHIFG